VVLVFLLLAVILRVTPKRETGSLSPNDIVGLVIVANLAAGARGRRADQRSAEALILQARSLRPFVRKIARSKQ